MYVFHINLDLPAPERYLQVTSFFEPVFPEIRTEIDNIYNSMVGYFSDYAIKFLLWCYDSMVHYKDELLYYSSVTGVEFHKLVLMQLFYECNSCCSSVGLKINGNNALFRTMDWELPFLKKITYEAHYYKSGSKLYSAIAWYGGVGQFTCVNDEFAVSINYRRNNNSFYQNLKRCLAGYWPVSYIVRRVFEENLPGFIAQTVLHNSPLIAPTYFTFVHRSGSPKVFIRDPINCQTFSEPTVSQCNHDQISNQATNSKGLDLSQDNIMLSFERKAMCESILNNKINFADNKEVFDTFLKHPILNEETIYACIMVPQIFAIDAKLV